MMKKWGSVLFLSLALGLSGCTSDDDDSLDTSGTGDSDVVDQGEDDDAGASLENVTFYKDIKPIVNSNCASCHTADGAGLFDMTTYETAKPWALAMAMAVETKDMPPWAAYETEECTPRFAWKNDHRLTDEQVALVRAWADAGAPAGDPEDDTSEVATAPSTLSEYHFEGSASLPVNVEPGQDSFLCIVIDPGLEEDTWLRGIEVIPDNEALVHHVVLFTDPTRASLALANEEGYYTCFGSANVPGSIASAWAPGQPAFVLADDMATRVEAGTLFVMQMHYSPQGGSSNLADKTRLRFQYADSPPKYEVHTQIMGSAPGAIEESLHPAMGILPSEGDEDSVVFKIPAESTGHTETVRWTFDGRFPTVSGGFGSGTRLDEVKLLSVIPHMHYAGVDMKVKVNRPVPGKTMCEPSMLTSVLLCGQAAGCPQDFGFYACAKNNCPEAYDAVSLGCWGCAHNATIQGYYSGDPLSELLACETAVAADYTTEQPEEECLLSAPNYTFEWQLTYEYDAPFETLPSFVPGSVLSIECSYDNTLDNELIASALLRQGLDTPQDIYLGDETLDEMCVVVLRFAFERQD